ncbi:MmgE/PrpD family protein [Paracoccus saliphilus]|uniref:2-methylcitrate dehydratase PrpD n=1 Tax=Paracoccus saliphilus TaxID=405559 RepID=A0AA45W0Q2_9RHOB|nr:MmgE/PrpD family protein [Paracoccus saliphilus]WCR03269.1 MmgE/PrpD family protein [Paracoccus saliphilus]SIS50522.1 2-methylcitrate dehydratase PrpD [Paracoccus saliphilus]
MPGFHDFLHDTSAADLPDEVLALGRRWLLDLLGVAAGGSRTSLSRIIRNHAAEHFAAGSKGAAMLMDGRRVSPAGAALAGGMTIDSLDGHDGHKLTKGHVGCGLLPALLAISQAEGLTDDREFLASLVLGYEIGTRAGIALHRTASDYHTSGAWIAVAVAALTARLLGLDHARTRHAIGIAEYHGPRSQMMRCIDHPTMLKDGSGWGAMAGVSAGYLAADGFTGAPAITVEAEDTADLWSDLGERWRIAEQYFKLWPVCRWAQPPVQAALNLRAEHGLTSEQVERIEIVTFHQSLRLAIREPATTEEAQYSTAYPTAVALARGRVDPADIAGESFADPEIRRLAASITITENEDYNAAFPHRRIADLRLVMRDGRVLTSGPTEAIGDPEAPVPMAMLRGKYRAYALPVLGETATADLEQAVDRLGDGSGTERFFGLAGRR